MRWHCVVAMITFLCLHDFPAKWRRRGRVALWRFSCVVAVLISDVHFSFSLMTWVYRLVQDRMDEKRSQITNRWNILDVFCQQEARNTRQPADLACMLFVFPPPEILSTSLFRCTKFIKCVCLSKSFWRPHCCHPKRARARSLSLSLS